MLTGIKYACILITSTNKEGNIMNIEAKRIAIKSFIKSLKGSIYTIEFTKKTTGELRVMNCRQNVFKHSSGGSNNLDGKPDVIGTYDVQIANKLPEEERKKAYRAIWLDGVKSIRGGGQEVVFS